MKLRSIFRAQFTKSPRTRKPPTPRDSVITDMEDKRLAEHDIHDKEGLEKNTASASADESSLSRLMTIYLEVRSLIYEYVFEFDSACYIQNPTVTQQDRNHRAIIRTCKQAYLETTTLLYSTRVFKISDQYERDSLTKTKVTRFLHKIGPRNRAYIKRIDMDFTDNESPIIFDCQCCVRGVRKMRYGCDKQQHHNLFARLRAVLAVNVLAHGISTQPLCLKELSIVVPGFEWLATEQGRKQKKVFQKVMKRIQGLEVVSLGYTREWDWALDLSIQMRAKKIRVVWRATEKLTKDEMKDLHAASWVLENDNNGIPVAANRDLRQFSPRTLGLASLIESPSPKS